MKRRVGNAPVMIVEDREVFRLGLRTVLEKAGVNVIAEYATAAAALEDEVKSESLEPGTIVLCSLSLEGWKDVVHRLFLQQPDSPVLGLVDQMTDEVAIEALNSGVLHCIERTLPPEELVATLGNVQAGGISRGRTILQVPAAARHALILLSQPPAPQGISPLAPVLSQRERLALSNLSEGFSVDAIVERMGISEETLNDLLESVSRKLLASRRLSGTVKQLQ